MKNFNKISMVKLFVLFLMMGIVITQGVNFSTYVHWQTGQYILYDQPYLAITAPSLYNITYDTPFAAGTAASAGVVIAGI
jgi:hypothetical protein